MLVPRWEIEEICQTTKNLSIGSHAGPLWECAGVTDIRIHHPQGLAPIYHWACILSTLRVIASDPCRDTTPLDRAPKLIWRRPWGWSFRMRALSMSSRLRVSAYTVSRETQKTSGRLLKVWERCTTFEERVRRGRAAKGQMPNSVGLVPVYF